MSYRWRLVLLSLALLLMATGPGCVLLPAAAPTPTPTATPAPTQAPTPSPWPTPTPEPPDTGWRTVRPGVEWRLLRVETGAVAERLHIVRLDPSQVRFRVLYDPGNPHPVSTWAGTLRTLLVVNGGYFSPEYEAVGLVVSDGEVWGASYGSFAGMFTVTAAGEVSVRYLAARPYDPDEPLQEAVQSFPVLVKPGGVLGFPADADDGSPARRTVVAQDRAGRILFIVAPRGYLSLHQLAAFLTDSDLEVDIALNLDGGTSSGMWLRGDDGASLVAVDSQSPVPVVIAADPRP